MFRVAIPPETATVPIVVAPSLNVTLPVGANTPHKRRFNRSGKDHLLTIGGRSGVRAQKRRCRYVG